MTTVSSFFGPSCASFTPISWTNIVMQTAALVLQQHPSLRQLRPQRTRRFSWANTPLKAWPLSVSRIETIWNARSRRRRYMTGLERNADVVRMASYAPALRQCRGLAMDAGHDLGQQPAMLRDSQLLRANALQPQSRQRRASVACDTPVAEGDAPSFSLFPQRGAMWPADHHQSRQRISGTCGIRG